MLTKLSCAVEIYPKPITHHCLFSHIGLVDYLSGVHAVLSQFESFLKKIWIIYLKINVNFGNFSSMTTKNSPFLSIGAYFTLFWMQT